jgi:hypothetical protein
MDKLTKLRPEELLQREVDSLDHRKSWIKVHLKRQIYGRVIWLCRALIYLIE